MSPDATGVLAGSATVAVLCIAYLWSEGSRRLHHSQDRDDRFDVFPDDVMGVADAVQGAASATVQEPTPLYAAARDYATVEALWALPAVEETQR